MTSLYSYADHAKIDPRVSWLKEGLAVLSIPTVYNYGLEDVAMERSVALSYVKYLTEALLKGYHATDRNSVDQSKALRPKDENETLLTAAKDWFQRATFIGGVIRAPPEIDINTPLHIPDDWRNTRLRFATGEGGLYINPLDYAATLVKKTEGDKAEVDNTEVDNTEDDKTDVDKTEDDKTGDDKTGDDKTEDDKTEDDKTKDDKTKEERAKFFLSTEHQHTLRMHTERMTTEYHPDDGLLRLKIVPSVIMCNRDTHHRGVPDTEMRDTLQEFRETLSVELSKADHRHTRLSLLYGNQVPWQVEKLFRDIGKGQFQSKGTTCEELQASQLQFGKEYTIDLTIPSKGIDKHVNNVFELHRLTDMRNEKHDKRDTGIAKRRVEDESRATQLKELHGPGDKYVVHNDGTKSMTTMYEEAKAKERKRGEECDEYFDVETRLGYEPHNRATAIPAITDKCAKEIVSHLTKKRPSGCSEENWAWTMGRVAEHVAQSLKLHLYTLGSEVSAPSIELSPVKIIHPRGLERGSTSTSEHKVHSDEYLAGRKDVPTHIITKVGDPKHQPSEPRSEWDVATKAEHFIPITYASTGTAVEKSSAVSRLTNGLKEMGRGFKEKVSSLGHTENA